MDEVKDIRDKAQAMAAYARQARDTDMMQWATEIKVRAEVRCGGLLRESAKTGERENGKGNRNQALKSHAGIPKLDELGITPNQSSRWQKLATIPEQHFEAAIAAAKETGGVVTTAHMLRLADQLNKSAGLRNDLETNARQARWRTLRWRLDAVCEAITELRRTDTPACDPEENGRILIAWRALDIFLTEELGYGSQGNE